VPLPSRVPSRWGSRYPKICTSLTPFAWRHIVNGSAVVAIGVDRRAVGRDNNARRLYLLFSKKFILRSSHPALVSGIMLLVERVVVR
jgi:hypothetical protein